jgi:ATP-dependent RNA helicase DeaD
MPASWAHHVAAEFVPQVVAPVPKPVATPAGAPPADFAFGELKLTEPVRRAVWEAGYRQPTPIQAAAVPILLTGKDCVGQAQTGTGKTAAFGIPIVESVDPQRHEVQALVLLPTRELCRQVATELERLGKYRGLQTLAVYGGEGMGRQLDALRAGVHVVVGTPGRVQDHIWRGTLKLDAVRFAVLDEADEMLDVGFAEDIERILRCVPQQRQTALFSATVPPFVRTLVRRYMNDPEWISTVDQTQVSRIPTQIRQQYINVAERDKLEALEEISRAEPGYNRVLVFRRMKIHSDRLAEAMRRKGYSVRALHGDLPQGERNRVLEEFKAGRIQFLVATNVAARGLDIRDVSHVLNYDMPDTPEEYVHRIGRTGRAGKEGTAISFVAEWDFDAFEAIKATVGDALTERPLTLYTSR